MDNLCTQCGAPTRPGMTKCEYCGAVLAQPAQQHTPQPVQQYTPQPAQQYAPQYSQPYVPQPQPVYLNVNSYNDGINPSWPVKSKITAGILALLLGGLGVHEFYLGRTGKGLLMLLFCWTYIPGIIAFIQGISILCSNDHNFQIKYQCRLH